MQDGISKANERSGIEKMPPDVVNQSHYISNSAHCPPYKNTTVEYLPMGEVKFERMVQELKKAKRYIFMEYFIIQEGTMWNTILDVLEEKAKEGVDVRVIYDDISHGLGVLPAGGKPGQVHHPADVLPGDGGFLKTAAADPLPDAFCGGHGMRRSFWE